MPMHARSRLKKMTGPIFFTISLVIIFVLSMVGIFINAWPLVLGTEINANGHIEYLCLGNGCDSRSQMSWVD